MQAMVAQVRSFNRLVAERIGAMDQDFLGRQRPLAEARLLWEIGEDGCDVRELRCRLGLERATWHACCARWSGSGWSPSRRRPATGASAAPG